MFSRDHQAGPASEWETSGATKNAWDAGRGSGQTEVANAQGICECVCVCKSKEQGHCVNFRPDWLKEDRTWLSMVMWQSCRQLCQCPLRVSVCACLGCTLSLGE